ncbi:hypothetical protein COLO4_27847 [Corchorus olitorius]|uniref:SBP-type domain-containing protein n=1 Tax=Corchorus olitorius TaxID=93759 RepID=A0A1R3HP24_9ROSI|nr:hypothetical protein COLO4_27847 [Corchorus olitorius]
MDLPVDSYARSRKALIGGWDLKPSTDFEAVESMELMDFGFADMNKRPFYGNTSMGIFGAEFGNDSAKRVVSPTCMFTSSSYYGEEESGSKHSSSLMESNSQESSLIDLKLGRLADYRDAHDGKFLKETSVVSSVRPALMAKKPRSSYTHTPCCQVYGCNKDLSSSKDYHKRHKVCEVHSKTAKFQLVKSERKPICSPQSAIPITNGQLGAKSFFHMHGSGKQCVPGTFSSATEGFNAPNAASTVKDSSGVSRSGCALSLLSAQSQDLSSHATGIQMTRPMVNQAGRVYHSFEKSAGVSSLEKANGVYTCEMNPMGVVQAGTIMVSDAGYSSNFEVQADGYFQDSDLLSARVRGRFAKASPNNVPKDEERQRVSNYKP